MINKGRKQGESLTMISALEVARYFLNKANREGDLITNLKMQKLLYYAQAWYLVNYDVPLFKEAIKPWKLGPVIVEVYHKFKEFGSSPIFYKSNNREADVFSKNQIKYLDEFYDAFFKFTAHELVNMSHNEDPWKSAFEKKKKEISQEDMKRYYKNLLRPHGKNVSQK